MAMKGLSEAVEKEPAIRNNKGILNAEVPLMFTAKHNVSRIWTKIMLHTSHTYGMKHFFSQTNFQYFMLMLRSFHSLWLRIAIPQLNYKLLQFDYYLRHEFARSLHGVFCLKSSESWKVSGAAISGSLSVSQA